MNQAKYSVYACLILCLLLIGVYSFNKLSSVQFIEEKNSYKIENVTPTSAEINSKGKQLFQQNCASCHSITKDLTGPALAGVEERGPWTDRKNLVKWIQNPAAFMQTSEYTRNLKNKYGTMMTSFSQLKEDEIFELLDYIKFYTYSPRVMP
jgi:cytochrome c2